MIKVAILEDDLEIQKMYQTKLEDEGFEVRVADDGNDGLTVVKDFHPDVILLDVMMPKLSGIDFIATLRRDKKYDDTQIIILTNLDDPNLRKSLEKINISGYLVKAEVTPGQVVEKIRSLVKSANL